MKTEKTKKDFKDKDVDDSLVEPIKPYHHLPEDDKAFIHEVYSWLLQHIQCLSQENPQYRDNIQTHFEKDRGIAEGLFKESYLQDLNYLPCQELQRAGRNLIRAITQRSTGSVVLDSLQGITTKRLLIVPGFEQGKATQFGKVDFISVWNKAEGFIIPLRDIRGRIHSLKLRLLNPSPSMGKYLYLSHPEESEYKYKVPTWHFPILRKEGKTLSIQDFDTVYITEGEIKAHTCNILQSPTFTKTENGKYTISIGGIKNYQGAIDEISRFRHIKKIVIVFDSDAWVDPDKHRSPDDVNLDFLHSLISIFEESKRLGLQCTFLKWDERKRDEKSLHYNSWDLFSERLKGIDDVLLQRYNYYTMREVPAEDMPLDMGIKEYDSSILCEEKEKAWEIMGWARWLKYISSEGVFVNVTVNPYLEYTKETVITLPSVKKQFKTIKAINEILTNPTFPTYDARDYFPQVKKSFVDSGGTALIYNTYTPPAIGCIEPNLGDPNDPVNLWLDHIAYILPDPKEQEIFHWWVANLIKTPWKKVMWVIFLQGGPGIGKSVIANTLAKLVGEHNTTRPKDDVLKEKHNDWMENAVLVIMEEFDGHDKIGFFNSMKTAITEKKVSISKKYKNPRTINNFCNIIMITNNPLALRIDDKERRYVPLLSKAVPKEGKDPYAPLWDNVFNSDEGLAKLNYYYRNLEMETEISHYKLPVVKGLEQVRNTSKDELHCMMEDLMDDEDSIFQEYEIISFNDLRAYIRNKYPNLRVTSGYLANTLAKLPVVRFGDVKFGGENCLVGDVRIKAKRRTFYAVSNLEEWGKATSDDVREYILKKYGSRLNLPTPLPLSNESMSYHDTSWQNESTTSSF